VDRWVTGSFSSNAQSRRDSSFVDIRLQSVRIWPHRIDGLWIYVEQALAATPHLPYRQRVHHIFPLNDSTLVNQPYELKNPAPAIGAWQHEQPFHALRTDSLLMQQGCAVFMGTTADSLYRGATPHRQCLSQLAGAAYMTTDVQIGPDKIVLWDRGWDASGRQVWGSANGGYEFTRQRETKSETKD